MPLMFPAITQHLLTNRRHPISIPVSALYYPRFFEQHKARGSVLVVEPPAQSNGKRPLPNAWTPHRQSPHLPRGLSNEIPAPLTVWPVGELVYPLPCGTLTRTRSPTLAAVTKTCKTNPKVSTVINRLRPLIFLPASKPTCWLTIAALFTLWLSMIASDGLGWRSISILVHSRRLSWMCNHVPSLRQLRKYVYTGLPCREIARQRSPSHSF